MTQFQFDMICTILDKGAPAVAPDLINSLSNVITEYNSAVSENAILKAEVERLSSEPCDSCECADGKCCDDK